ncbi:MAG: purine-nucleoside phosphorylase [Firmicutes bacterium]|nr:purine-nucleoside phosphorylase [Bacillota bacterium]
MNPAYEKLQQCFKTFREKINFTPDIALILGSGLGGFADEIEQTAILDYSEIDGFPQSTVPGHKGRFVFGYINGVKVVVMQGRIHYYEGYPISDVVLPTRLMGLMGAKALFLTNAAGGVNPDFNAGDFMLIEDHIMNFFPNPLVGENIDEIGTRFPDMSDVYTPELRQAIQDAAKELSIELKSGVYAQLTGPSFETPAEIRMLGKMGVDAVGMSTACEATAARHMGLKICGISCISNKGAGLSANPLTHAEVQETADSVAPFFKKLVAKSIENIAKII